MSFTFGPDKLFGCAGFTGIVCNMTKKPLQHGLVIRDYMNGP